MHILLLTKNYPPQIGGIEKYAYDLYNSLLEKTKIEGEIEGGSFIKNSETNPVSSEKPVNQVSSVKLIAAGPRNEYLLTKSGSQSKQATVDSKQIKNTVYSLWSAVYGLQSPIYRILYILSELSRLSWFAVRAITAGTLWSIKTMNDKRGTSNEVLIWSLDGSITWLGLLVKKITCIIAPLTRASSRELSRTGVSVARGVLTRVTGHGRDIAWNKPFYKKLLTHSLKHTDSIIAVSSTIKDLIVALGIDASKITIQEHSMQSLILPKVDHFDKKELLEKYGIPADKILLFSIGRFVEKKGFHWFAREVLPFLDQKFHYVLAGNGPLESTIRDICIQKNIQNISLIGSIYDEHEKARLYSTMNYFIMPNIAVPGDCEGFGLVLLEAQFYGLTIIASKIDGIETRVGENDVVLPMKDAKKWISYVNSLQ